MTERNKKYTGRTYSLEPYNPEWETLFEGYKTKLHQILAGLPVAIEHIGSTAIPKLSAKPIIDILVICPDIDHVREKQNLLEEAGFTFEGEHVKPGALLYRKLEGDNIKANIHFFPTDHSHIHEMLTVRDYLLIHPEEVDAYNTTKKNLFDSYSNDYASYRKYKDRYMEELMKRVRL